MCRHRHSHAVGAFPAPHGLQAPRRTPARTCTDARRGLSRRPGAGRGRQEGRCRLVGPSQPPLGMKSGCVTAACPDRASASTVAAPVCVEGELQLRRRLSAATDAGLLLLVQRDNADTDELRGRTALQSSRAGSTAACGCCWATAAAPGLVALWLYGAALGERPARAPATAFDRGVSKGSAST